MQYPNDLSTHRRRHDNTNVNTLANNLRALMSLRGISENRLATETGVPQPTIHRVISGKARDPRDGTLRPLAAFFGVTVEQLRTGEGLNRPEVRDRIAAYEVKAFEDGEDLDREREIQIAEVDIVVSGGHGAPMPEFVETSYRMAYQLSWFRAVNAKPENVRVMKVHGDSMERTLFHGDRIAVNTADNEVSDGRVYVFMTPGPYPDIKVKRLYRTISGQLRIVSDNPDKVQYPDEFLDAEDAAGIVIIGRVIDRSGRGGL